MFTFHLFSFIHHLVGKKYDRHGGKKPGPVPISPEYVEMILKMSHGNPEWGYARIADCMAHVGMKVSASTVKRVLDDHGIVPYPERKKHVDWYEFIQSHRAVIAATDFLTVEVMENEHLERYHILFSFDSTLEKWNLAAFNIILMKDGCCRWPETRRTHLMAS